VAGTFTNLQEISFSDTPARSLTDGTWVDLIADESGPFPMAEWFSRQSGRQRQTFSAMLGAFRLNRRFTARLFGVFQS
jgi:hypothetical protein